MDQDDFCVQVVVVFGYDGFLVGLLLCGGLFFGDVGLVGDQYVDLVGVGFFWYQWFYFDVYWYLDVVGEVVGYVLVIYGCFDIGYQVVQCLLVFFGVGGNFGDDVDGGKLVCVDF